MKCEYCDTIYSDEITGTCPNCGAALPEKVFFSSGTVGASMDEERREELKEAGCKYCPYCLSTNVSKLGGATRIFFVILFVLTCLLAVVFPLLLVFSLFCLLCLWGTFIILSCDDCKIIWSPSEANVYEKYRFQLNSVLETQATVQCPGINRQSVSMNIHSVRMLHGSKKRNVRYDQLVQVYHRVPAGDSFGYLTIRSILNKDRPIPENYKEAADDLMTVVYEAEYEPQYCAMYQALEEIAQMNAETMH